MLTGLLVQVLSLFTKAAPSEALVSMVKLLGTILLLTFAVGFFVSYIETNATTRERLIWVKKVAEAREEQKKVAAEAIRKESERALAAVSRASQLEERIREIENDTKHQVEDCIDASTADRLRRLRRK